MELFDVHFQAGDANGLPLSGAKLAFYRAGTNSLVTVYQDAGGTTPHTNPVAADAAGLFPPIYVNTIYPLKTILKTSAGVTVQTVPSINPAPVGIDAGMYVVGTLAALTAVTPSTEFDEGQVLADATASNNGFYYRSAGAWVKGRGFPDTIAKLTVTGGTANAVEASTSSGVDPSNIVAFYIDIATPNSGNVTVSVNGSAAVPAYNINGAQFAAGEWNGRMFLSNGTTSVKALNDAAAAASAAASAAAADASADSAAASAAAAGAASGRLDFNSFAELASDFVYSSPGAGQQTVAAGDVILWREKGFAYRVAASGASDWHLDYSGVGGVKLYVLPGMGGKQYCEAWGVVADGVTDYRAVIQSIIDKTTGALTVVLPAGTTKGTSTIYLRRSRVGIEGAGPGGQSFYMYSNAAGGRAFCGDTDESVSMNTYTGNFLRDFEVLSTGVETNDADIVVDFTSFSYGTFDIRIQSKRANAILYYGQGNNGASPYYNKIASTGLFGWIDQTQIAFVFEHGLWSGGSPGPNSNFIGPITEAPLFKNFAHIKAGQANHFSMLGIESIKDAYFLLGGRAPSDPGGFSSGSNTHLTLNDTTKSWVSNIHSGSTVRTIGGTGPGQIRKITSNTGTQLVVQDPWAIIPGSDTTYEIYKPYAISNHFSHIRGEDTNAENPEFVRALWDSDDFSFDSWYVDSIGTGSLFEDYTGSVNNKVLGSKTFITYTFKNPGTSVVVDAWERSSSNGGLPIPGKYSVDFVAVRKSLGNTGGTITVNLDCGGSAAGGGGPALLISSPTGFGSGMDMPLPTEKGPIVGTNNPLFLTLTTGSDVTAGEDFTVTVGLSLFD